MKKQFVSGLLAVVMAASSMAVPASNLVSTVNETGIVASAATEYTSGDYKYTVSGGKATITKYSGLAKNLVIPSELDGYKVTKIGKRAFFNETPTLQNVVIPDTVTSIGSQAFYYSWLLTGVTIPDSVTTIGSEAFLDCKSLESVLIPESVTKIGDYALGYETGAYGNYLVDFFVIKGYSGGTAKTYAKNNKIVFKNATTKNYVVPQVTGCYWYLSSSSSINIDWNVVPGATGYRIYRYNSTTKKWKKIKTITNGSTFYYTDTGLKAGTTYKYKIKAYKKGNGKTYWGDASETLKASTAPAKVTIKSASKSKTSIRINWKKVTGATGYKVERYNSSTKEWETIKTIKSSSTLTYKDTGLKSGTVYKYRVFAYRKIAEKTLYGANSATKKVTTKS